MIIDNLTSEVKFINTAFITMVSTIIEISSVINNSNEL